jgi:hypothetical protein
MWWIEGQAWRKRCKVTSIIAFDGVVDRKGGKRELVVERTKSENYGVGTSGLLNYLLIT